MTNATHNTYTNCLLKYIEKDFRDFFVCFGFQEKYEINFVYYKSGYKL